MPKETDRLKLPLPLGNENVTRESINGIFEKIDAGVATQADLETLREAVSKMDIPDASLTQKGKVQLSSKTDGSSETLAATEKAVRDARVAAISAAATDATTKSNAAETNARDYINAKPWQRVRVTADDGSTMMLSSGYDINSDMSTGFYRGVGIVNAPDSGWWHFEVLKHDSSYATQVAYPLDRSYTYRMRVKSGGIWGPWSPDVFQSGVDAKNGIVGAINAKGGSASTSDTWAQLSAKVTAIKQPYRVYNASVWYAGGTISNIPFKPYMVMVFVSGVKSDNTGGSTVDVRASGTIGAYVNESGSTVTIGGPGAQGYYGSSSAAMTNVVFGGNSVSFNISYGGYASNQGSLSVQVFGL
ncbi:tail fiber protein [Paenibacillus sp. JNUCC31]|uniref:pyocin knob domain-containing protein n=1 Tax=Paenibacillus sp. JNUCC-31 TaxID=2777983 RepID=UPI00177B1358|nr:pyocin knob domain-containing protein [Paenibacillus sp. JNUCC-31]QOS82586.1 tail fiber protein [Paenibacillus sp. JNUCC-31]